jgi:hypothetical protein
MSNVVVDERMDRWTFRALSEIANDTGASHAGNLVPHAPSRLHIPNHYCKILDLYVTCCRLKMIMQICSYLLSAQIAPSRIYAQTHLDLRQRHIVKCLKPGRDRWRFILETRCD